ncbi:MAG: OmpA family protein [Bacteroidales bacterium]|nr:OmpA family protein [Bacteroidales bacterium]
MKRLNLFFGAAALIAVSLTASTTLNAQENGNRDENGKIVRGPYETNRFGDNWFIGVGGGVNVFWNDGYEVAVGPSIDANIGKWFTPSIGMRMGYQGISSKAWLDHPTVLGPTLDSEKGKYQQKFGYMYVHGDFLWNISNAFSGYKETRFWNFVPYLHAGFFRSYGLDGVDFADNEFAAGGGLINNLRLTDRLDLVLDMRATVVSGRVSGGSGVAVLPTVTMGFAVDLGWPNFIRTSTVVGAVAAADADRISVLESAAAALEVANANLQEQNKSLASDNRKLSKEVSKLKNQPKYDPADFYKGMTPAAVYFNIGQAVLPEKELEHLDFIAKNILAKADDQCKVYITLQGTADSNTGSKSRNQQLSEARGQYVYDLLTGKYGISRDRLVVKSNVVKAADDPELSRAVTISF